jgi:hypothetical protein
LPSYVRDFGVDVSFWHRPAPAAYAAALDAFLRLEVTPDQWDAPSFEPVLRRFQRRFRDTRTEEGTIMSTILGYAIDETYANERRELLADFQSSDEVSRLLERGLSELEEERDAPVVSVTN